MNRVVVAASAYGADLVRQRGHAYLVPIVAAAGAAGFEIRRELWTEKDDVGALRDTLQQYQLFSIYSAPLELFDEQGALADAELEQRMAEAAQLKSRYLKVSLGHFSLSSDLLMLTRILARSPVPLLLENDQTEHGGKLEAISGFFVVCGNMGLSIGMTFDMGNWHWSGVDPFAAAKTLAAHVQYVHCKGVHTVNGKLTAVPLAAEDTKWKNIMRHFPRQVQRAIEFPLIGDDLLEVTRHYVSLLSTI